MWSPPGSQILPHADGNYQELWQCSKNKADCSYCTQLWNAGLAWLVLVSASASSLCLMSGNFPPSPGCEGPSSRLIVINISCAEPGHPGPTAMSQLTTVKSVNPGPVEGRGGRDHPVITNPQWSPCLIPTADWNPPGSVIVPLIDYHSRYIQIFHQRRSPVTTTVSSVNNPLDLCKQMTKISQNNLWGNDLYTSNPVCLIKMPPLQSYIIWFKQIWQTCLWAKR